MYGEGDKSERCLRRVDGQVAHSSGYFEILNKSDYVTAIRVCDGGSETLREHCRPSYFARNIPPLSPFSSPSSSPFSYNPSLITLPLTSLIVLPQQCLYTTFDPSIRILEIAVLHRNPHLLFPNAPINSLIYNTRGDEVTKELISPQCAVENFTEICVYSIVCEGKNVILKYQGGGVIELRKLTTTKMSKKGPLSMFTSLLSSSSSSPSSSTTAAPSGGGGAPSTSSSTAGSGSTPGAGDSILDFSTNATEISRDLASNLF